ncbi:4Fe-4S binding protein [Candidatus Acidulodesulfobacterium sp. H_13]|uniref:4Fe-4S binding protein n=1 Tax=Candidatus Acidulodesulfobacterium sp. H_13 TaxID=3395470 RepID=UPI003AF77504
MNMLSLLGKLLYAGSDVSIAINPDFCVRLETPMSGCYECINRCPELSIEITDSDIKILENCTNCGACLYMCPNSVFYSKGKKITNYEYTILESKNIYFFCSKIDSKITESNKNIKFIDKINKIGCLHEIDDIDIISFIKNEKKLFFIEGNCKSCKFKYFYGKKVKRLNEIKKFLNCEENIVEVNIEDFDVCKIIAEENLLICSNDINADTEKDDKKKDEAHILGRREFFKHSFSGIKEKAGEMMNNITVEDLPLVGIYSNYIDLGDGNGGKSNKLLVERQKKQYIFLKENEDLLSLINIRLPKLNNNCVFCSNCWELCPTDALSFKKNAILLEPFLCTGCDLCRDICSFGAVRMYKAKSLKDVDRQKVLLLQNETS